ncbi:hypothetical protein BYT27DRAFT_7070751, partial [Phlegmacium glaucopus]
HASLRNVIERIFGVCKRRFKLMAAAAEYSIHTQAKIPGAIAALHNFVHVHDPDDLAEEDGDNSDDSDDEETPHRQPHEIPITPENLGGHISQAEKDRASAKRDEIAKAMWEKYVEELRIRNMV